MPNSQHFAHCFSCHPPSPSTFLLFVLLSAGKFKKLDEKYLEQADSALTSGIPALLKQLGEEQDAKAHYEKERHMAFLDGGIANPTSVDSYNPVAARAASAQAEAAAGPSGAGGAGAITAASDGGSSAGNPFGGGAAAPSPIYAAWSAFIGKADSDAVFRLLPGGQEGLVSGAGAKDVLLESGLDVGILRTIWDLADVDKDGFLDRDEFAVAMYLMQQSKAGKPLPTQLPPNVVPPTKR